MTRRALRRGALSSLSVAVVSVALVSGCAQIPTAGPVERGDQVQGTDDDPPVRVLPRGPVAGQSPIQVVKGFIDASASFENDHEVARKFLTPQADATWNPETGVTVIDDNPRRTFKADGSQVDLFAEQTASITAGGAFIPRGGVPITASFQLKKEGDSWQISKVPQGLILDRIEVSLSYRAFDIFFMNPENSLLVPDPVYLPVEQSGSATSLVQALLDGPTSWLRPAVESLIPAGTHLVVESVPVENGIAKVDLSAEFLDAEPAALELAAAQITSTLLELSSSVTGVEIRVEGQQLLPSEPTVFTADTWDRYEPDALTPALGPIFVRNGVVQRFEDGKADPVQGALGRGGHDVREPSQSWDGSTVTALDQTSSRLLVTHPFVSAGVAHVESGRHLLPATIDADGRLWSLDVGGKRPQLRVLEGDHWRAAGLQAPPGDIRSFRVSADGTRMAMVLRTKGERARTGQLLIGRVVQGADRLRVEAFRRIELSLSKVKDASWVDSTTLAVIGTSSGQTVGPLLININRTVTPLSTDALAHFTSVVGAPSLPLMAATSQNQIWESSGSGWTKLVRGSDPAYPG